VTVWQNDLLQRANRSKGTQGPLTKFSACLQSSTIKIGQRFLLAQSVAISFSLPDVARSQAVVVVDIKTKVAFSFHFFSPAIFHAILCQRISSTFLRN
jgi:hypothetical protein